MPANESAGSPDDLLLALDTSTRTASVALVARQGRVIAAEAREVSTHSEMLLPLVDQVLGQARCALSDLAAIACGAGPGSFTGLRIGLGTAKGLCFASEKPLVLVSSLAAMAAQIEDSTLALACLDARKGEIFVGTYREGKQVGAERTVRPRDLFAVSAELRAGGGRESLTLIGDAALAYPELRDLGAWRDSVPRAREVALLAWQRLRSGSPKIGDDIGDDIGEAAPRYLREPEIYKDVKKVR